jgi:hypothetical protein
VFLWWSAAVGVIALTVVILLGIAVGLWLRSRQDATETQRRRDWRWWETHFEAMRRTAVDMLGDGIGLGQALDLVNRRFLKHLQETSQPPVDRRTPMPPPGCHLPFDLLIHREENGKVKEG